MMQPSTHRIPLPSPQITYRRYRAPIPLSESSEGSQRRGNLLERVWREINETGGEWAEGCSGVLVNTEEGVLWVFGDGEEVRELEDIDTHTLDTRKLVLCSAHGNDLGCLGSDRKCDVKWLPGDQDAAWRMFGRALVEKMEWREGRRAFTDRTDGPIIDLWPVPTDCLLLVIKSPAPPRPVAKQTSNLPGIVTLQPIGLAALPVSHFDPSPAQLHTLEIEFSNALGPSWNPSSTLMDLDDLLESAKPAWSVYWVSTTLDPLVGLSLESIKDKQGVMTIWPSHLVSTHTNLAPDIGKSYRKPLPAFDFPEPDSLMSLASGLFDFMAAYEPPVEDGHMEITPETDGPEYSDSSPVSHMPTHPIFSPTSPASPAKSDGSLDDLFSAHSPTPPPNAEPDASIAQPDESGQQEEANDMSMDIDEVLFAPSPAQMNVMRDLDFDGNIGRGEVIGDMESERGEGAFVTEDDFAFFDSPSDEVQPPPASMPVDAASLRPEAILVEDLSATMPDAESGERAVDETRDSGPDHPPHSGTPGVEALNEDRTTAVVEEQVVEVPASPRTTVQAPEVKESAFDGQSPPSEAPPVYNPPTDKRPAPKKAVAFDLPPSPSPEPEAYLELVPTPYEPLDIDPNLPSFAYSLPTPAASPESGFPLRTDLIKRIQDISKDSLKLDYASHWDIESEASEFEEEEDNSGAPPTPVSILDDETQSSTLASPKVDARGESSELVWEGIILVGCEWTDLRWNRREVDRLARGWKDSWGKNRLGQGPPTPEAEVMDLKLEEADRDSLVQEIVASRHLREMLLEAEGGDLAIASGVSHSSGMSGAVSTDKTSQPLPPCQIHVGLHGNVCQMGVSALHYWRQLGLQPVGGKKNVSALVVCDIDEGSVVAARRFLHNISSVYESCLLGSHSVGESAASIDGIISIPPAGYADAIAGILTHVQPNTIVYAILPAVAPTSLARLIGKLLSPKLAAPDTVCIKLIPLSALPESSLQSIAFETYDHLPRPLHATTLRGMPLEPEVPYAQYHSFTLASDGPLQPELTLAWPLQSYDVLNRWRVVHCAYGFDLARRTVVGFGIDAEGEGWTSKVFTLEGEGPGAVASVLSGLWEFYTEFARLASIEFRLVIASAGPMSKAEIDTWRGLIDKTKIPASLVVAELPDTPSSPRSFGTSLTTMIPPSIFADPATRLIDESLSCTSFDLPRIPLSLPAGSHTIPLVSFGLAGVSTPPTAMGAGTNMSAHTGTGSVDGVYHVLLHRCPSDREDKAAELISRQYYKLACLGRMRHGLPVGAGPLHLEFVRMASRCIDMFT